MPILMDIAILSMWPTIVPSRCAHSALSCWVLFAWVRRGLLTHLLTNAPPAQVFVVVTDSVAKQLDGLKQDPSARAAVRHFMGQGLDAWGPAGEKRLAL